MTKTDPVEGLGKYVHAVAHALQRDQGMSEEHAIATAIAAIKHWASGGGKVSDATRARAQAAVAHWEGLKAASHGSRAAAGPSQYYRRGVTDKAKGRPPLNVGQFLSANPNATGGDWLDYFNGYTADLGAVPYGGLQPPGDTATDHDIEVLQTLARGTLDKPHKCWRCKNQASKAFIWADGRAFIPSCDGHADKTRHHIEVTNHDEVTKVVDLPQTRMGRALAGLRDAMGGAVGEWASSGPPTPDASGSANLLPVGPSKKKAADIVEGIETHRFVGKDLSSCGRCGKPVSNPAHRSAKRPSAGTRAESVVIRERAASAKASHDRAAASLEEPLEATLAKFFADQRISTVSRLTGKRGKQMLKRAGVRAAQPQLGGAPGPGSPPPVGSAGKVTPAQVGSTLGSGVTTVALPAGTVTVAALAAALGVPTAEVARRLGYPDEAHLTAALVAGLVTMAALRKAFPAQTAAVSSTAPPAMPGPLEPAAVFDQHHWDDRLATLLKPYYETAAVSGSANARAHLHLPADFDDRSSVATARQLLADRGNQTSPQINETTYQAIVRALQAGVAAGEGLGELEQRVHAVFDEAESTRARRIAQTEVQAALNGAAYAYASALPSGRVGSKRWLSHWPPTGGADPRTRDAHRLAAGQTVGVTSPFYVGGYPMMYPGDPAAPPDLTVNCRCAVMYLPPGIAGEHLAAATERLVEAS